MPDIMPLFIMQAGEENGMDMEKPLVTIIEPKENYIYLFGKKIMEFKNTIIIGRMFAEIDVKDDSFLLLEVKVNGNLIGESYKMESKFKLPFGVGKCELEVIAKDYFGNIGKKEMEYVKIG